MPYGLYISAEGAYVQSRRLEVLANNLANADTVAFKRDEPIFQARLAEATQRGLDQPGSGSINDIGGGVVLAGTLTDFSQAALKQTGGATDLAINGEGFFVVQRGDQKLLTRSGNFVLDPEGMLRTADGDPVLSDTNTPILIDGTHPWQMSPDGAINQDGDTFYVAMVRPQSLADLTKIGENLYAPLAPVKPLAPEERNLAVGFLESSGVKPALEMMELIETSRAFEANTTLIRNQDQLLGSLVNRLLKEN